MCPMSVHDLVPIIKVERPFYGRKKSFRREKGVKRIGWWNSWCESKERKEERESESGEGAREGRRKREKKELLGLRKKLGKIAVGKMSEGNGEGDSKNKP